MAKGFLEYIIQEWEILETELLLDAYIKQNCNDQSEDLDLFENTTSSENDEILDKQ